MLIKMRSVHCVDILICSITLLIALSAVARAELSASKNRRGGTYGLNVFPRVGRSDPSMNNNLHDLDAGVGHGLDNFYPSLDDYEEFPKSDIKRANLMAFPRVGRNDVDIRKWARLMALQQALEKRTGPSATSGLWFGPRLGKRSVDPHEKHQGNTKSADKGEKEVY